VKKFIIFEFLVFFFIFGCGSSQKSNATEKTAEKTIKKAFGLPAEYKLQIKEIYGKSKESTSVFFRANNKLMSTKIRYYDQEWYLDEVQSEDDFGKPGQWLTYTPQMKEDRNELIKLEKEVLLKGEAVDIAYKKRANIVPNLVEAVKGAAAFEKDSFTSVTNALSKVKQVNLDEKTINDEKTFLEYQQAQDGLSDALSHILSVIKKYPDLNQKPDFRNLQVMLEGVKNRITVERMRFNEVSQKFNSLRLELFAGNFFQKKYYLFSTELLPEQKIIF